MPFLLFFTGLAQASAPSAAFIQKTLFIWVAMLAVPFLGERLGLAQLGALGVLLAGQLLVVMPRASPGASGESMIAAATVLWAVESILAKRVLRSVPSRVVGAARMGIGLVVLFGFLAVTGRLAALATLTAIQWGWVLVHRASCAGYVATWFAALQSRAGESRYRDPRPRRPGDREDPGPPDGRLPAARPRRAPG